MADEKNDSKMPQFAKYEGVYEFTRKEEERLAFLVDKANTNAVKTYSN